MLSLSDIVNVKVGIGRGVFEAPGATVIGGKKPSFNLEILKLFANGEQGFWYDPNDMGTMFQDAAGTVPVTAAGQPVGLMLDKSKGLVLGEELFLNSEFNTQDGWNLSPNISINNGVLKFTEASTARARYTVNTKAATWYLFSIDIASNPSGFLGLRVGGVLLSGFVSKTGRLEVFYLSTTAGANIFDICCSNLATTAEVNSASLKEIKGNHAYQTTSSARPILQNAPRRIDFDAVDDKLITNLPAQLTGCTVIRSVPGVGTQILTGQTIPATYEDNKDHCGLIVINRALTPSETSAITAEFNKRAGV